MFGSATLEVLIGLLFIYFVLSVVCSAVIESIAALFALRARALHDALEGLLDGTGIAVKTFVASPLIAPLAGKCRKNHTGKYLAGRGAGMPQYLPPDKFATAFLEQVANKHTPSALHKKHPYRALAVAAASPSAPLVLRTLVNRSDAQPTAGSPAPESDRLDHLHQQVEQWYQDTMDRATGWYKRLTQVLLFCVAVPLVAALNIDTISITQRLYTDKDTRAAIANAATQAAASQHAAQTQPGIDQTLLHQNVAELDRLSLPLGWSGVTLPPNHTWSFWRFWVRKSLGLLLTIFAVSLGSPFWFDTLSKLVNLRNTGIKPDDKNPPPAATPPAPAGASVTLLPATPAPPTPTLLPDDYWNRPARASDWTNFAAAPLDKAAALARAALLAYENDPFATAVITGKWNAASFKTFLQPGGTQAFIAAWNDFILIAFRGTQPAELADLVDDACCNPTTDANLGAGTFHGGFAASLKERLADLDATLDGLLKPNPRPIYITGHSLGAALATLYASHRLLAPQYANAHPATWLFTYGSPRVGDWTFARYLETALMFDRAAWEAGPTNNAALAASRVFRFVDHNDVVTRVPPRDKQFDHVGPTLYLRADGTLDLSMSEWSRFLNSLGDALTQLKLLALSSLGDHSMEKYLRILENPTDPRR
jgi:hypothetical protein